MPRLVRRQLELTVPVVHYDARNIVAELVPFAVRPWVEMKRAKLVMHYSMPVAICARHVKDRGRFASDEIDSELQHEIHALSCAERHQQRVTVSATMNHSDLHRFLGSGFACDFSFTRRTLI